MPGKGRSSAPSAWRRYYLLASNISAFPLSGIDFALHALQRLRPGRVMPYVSGGAGSGAREALHAMDQNFDVTLIFATSRGDYL